MSFGSLSGSRRFERQNTATLKPYRKSDVNLCGAKRSLQAQLLSDRYWSFQGVGLCRLQCTAVKIPNSIPWCQALGRMAPDFGEVRKFVFPGKLSGELGQNYFRCCKVSVSATILALVRFCKLRAGALEIPQRS